MVRQLFNDWHLFRCASDDWGENHLLVKFFSFSPLSSLSFVFFMYFLYSHPTAQSSSTSFPLTSLHLLTLLLLHLCCSLVTAIHVYNLRLSCSLRPVILSSYLRIHLLVLHLLFLTLCIPICIHLDHLLSIYNHSSCKWFFLFPLKMTSESFYLDDSTLICWNTI